MCDMKQGVPGLASTGPGHFELVFVGNFDMTLEMCVLQLTLSSFAPAGYVSSRIFNPENSKIYYKKHYG